MERPLQKPSEATEAMLLMRRALAALGSLRYGWKCDALNAALRAAALRLGFGYERVCVPKSHDPTITQLEWNRPIRKDTGQP